MSLYIGSGFAGLAAAISAREAGASIIVLEKRNSCGGNSVFSDGVLAIVNPNVHSLITLSCRICLAENKFNSFRQRNPFILLLLEILFYIN
ncbi:MULTISPECIES: FAD-binding protein [unclassified Okeania]|uniref:FAD-binding protein n=1 Tax=unclassified Okeania TaxID=2634635 RepID=UPI00257F5942|nr:MULTISPECIES: FAD-binding protein [unclassified Okeania]